MIKSLVYGVSVNAVAAFLASGAAYAQTAPQTPPTPAQSAAAATDDDEEDEDDKAASGGAGDVVVTGSRLRRSETEGPAPVTIISTDQVRKDGFATIYDALQTITEATGNVQNDYDWGVSSVNASPLNLRNLGPGRTLQLLNGRRVSDYPMPYAGKSNFANFANLPTGIVERVEILSGAASAIYGSDAMGGVVNVILKKKAEGHQARLRYGAATRGGTDNKELVLSGGFNGDNWNIVYNLQRFERGGLLAKDRPFMDEEADRLYSTWGVAERHYGVPKVNPYPGIYLRDMDLRSSFAANTNLAPPTGACDQFGDLFYPSVRRGYNRNTRAETNGGPYCAQRVFQDWSLRTGAKDTSGYLYGTTDLGSVELWSGLGIWHTQGTFNSFLPAFVSGNYWDPRANSGAGGSRLLLRFITPTDAKSTSVFLTRSNELAIDFSAGLRGKLNDTFNWDFSAGAARYTVDEKFPTQSEAALNQFFLGPNQGTYTSPTLGALPIYTPDYSRAWNPITPEQVESFSGTGLKKAKSELQQAQLVVSGKLFDGWAGPIQVATVLEAGRQSYLLTPDPKTLNPDADNWSTPFGNIEQGGGSRNRYAAGVELSIPLLKPLTLTAAGRYDKYDAVASDAAFTYQGGLEFRPFSRLLLRGTYGTSFRAPDMHFVYAKPSTGFADFTDYSACFKAGFPNSQCPRSDFLIDDAIVARQGTSELLYERGKSMSGGFVWDAFRDFSISVDYWRIDVNNLIDDVSADQVLLDEAFCQYGKTPDGTTRQPPPSEQLCALQISRVVRNAAGAVTQINTGPINRASTKVSGIDAKISWRAPEVWLGRFTFSAAYTEMLTNKRKQFASDPMTNFLRLESPRARANVTIGWVKGKVNANLFIYQKSGGRVAAYNGCAPFDDGYAPSPVVNCLDTDRASPTFNQSTYLIKEMRPARRYYNGSIGYQFTKNLRLNVYANNIFDKIYRDRWCGDFAYCVDNAVGRELSGEVVVNF